MKNYFVIFWMIIFSLIRCVLETPLKNVLLFIFLNVAPFDVSVSSLIVILLPSAKLEYMLLNIHLSIFLWELELFKSIEFDVSYKNYYEYCN